MSSTTETVAETRKPVTKKRRLTDGYLVEVVVLIALSVAPLFLLPDPPPLGIVIIGISSAALLALNAMGVVLVYRTNAFINFAQLQIGIFAAAFFSGMVRGQPFIRMLREVCYACVGEEPPGLMVAINYTLGVVMALVVGMAIPALLYQTLIRRFATAPRLMPALATIFLAQAAVAVQGQATGWMISRENFDQARAVYPPFNLDVTVGTVQIHSGDLLAIIVAVIASILLGIYLKGTRAGAAVRAAGENPDRARTLGMDVYGVTSRVWMLSGALSTLVGIMTVFISGGQVDVGGGGGGGGAGGGGGGGGGGPGGGASAPASIPTNQLVVVLAVAVIARFSNLPLTILGAIALATIRQGVQWSYGSTAPLDAMLILLVGGMLLVQRARTSRVASEQEAVGLDAARESRPMPQIMRTVPSVQIWTRRCFYGLALIILGLPWVLKVGQVELAGAYLIYALIGLSLLIVTGWAGQISLGQWGFATMGAWVAAVSGLPMLLAIPVAGVVGSIAAVIIGIPALKLKGLQLAVATLAFAVSARELFTGDRYLGKHVPRLINRPELLGIDLNEGKTFYYFLVLVLGISCLAVLGLRRSRFGRALIAVRTNEMAAQAFGLDPVKLRLRAFVAAGCLASVAGALFVFHQRSIAPESFTAEESIRLFTFNVIGGLGAMIGPILGTLFFAGLAFFSENQLLQYASAGMGGLVLLFAAPGGLAEVVYKARDQMLRRIAVRNRIYVPSLLGDRSFALVTGRVPLSMRHNQEGQGLRHRYKLPKQWALDRFGAQLVVRDENEDGTPDQLQRNEPAGTHGYASWPEERKASDEDDDRNGNGSQQGPELKGVPKRTESPPAPARVGPNGSSGNGHGGDHSSNGGTVSNDQVEGR